MKIYLDLRKWFVDGWIGPDDVQRLIKVLSYWIWSPGAIHFDVVDMLPVAVYIRNTSSSVIQVIELGETRNVDDGAWRQRSLDLQRNVANHILPQQLHSFVLDDKTRLRQRGTDHHMQDYIVVDFEPCSNGITNYLLSLL